MNATTPVAPQSATYLRFCTMHDPAARIAAHVDLAFECLARESARVEREAVMRAAVDAARMAA